MLRVQPVDKEGAQLRAPPLAGIPGPACDKSPEVRRLYGGPREDQSPNVLQMIQCFPNTVISPGVPQVQGELFDAQYLYKFSIEALGEIRIGWIDYVPESVHPSHPSQNHFPCRAKSSASPIDNFGCSFNSILTTRGSRLRLQLRPDMKRWFMERGESGCVEHLVEAMVVSEGDGARWRVR